MADRPRVVIVGAGFGGLAAAKRFQKQPVQVTIIDRRNFRTFQPLLYQVATAGLNAADVAYPTRGMFRKRPSVLFRQGEVIGVDWAGRRVLLAGADPIGYDYLILAAGSTTNYFGVPGAEEHSLPLYTLPDALMLRNHMLSLFEAADAKQGLLDDGILNFVIVGGGPTGVEVSGAIAELVNKVLVDDFHDLDVSRSKVILVEQSDRLLAPFDERLQEYTKKALTKRGVDIQLGKAVDEIGPDYVEFKGGERINTRMVVWAAGVRASDLAHNIGAPEGPGGRIAVDDDLRIDGHERVFAIGDVADTDDGDGGKLPQLARPAIQGGKHAAEQVLRLMGGETTKEFHYHDKGTMATIGRKAAVAELPFGPKLTGRLAWMSWLLLHLVYLAGFRNRISVMLNWLWNYLTWDRGPRLILNTEPMPMSMQQPPDTIPRPAGPPDES